MKEVTIKGIMRGYGFRADDLKKMCAICEENGGSGTAVEVTFKFRDPRADWVKLWYDRAVRAQDVFGTYTFAFVKDGTVCFEPYSHGKFTVAAPRKGDKYDRKVGMAVAYAKMKGERIPDYI